MFLHDAGINISTREPAVLRDKLIYLGVCSSSYCSKVRDGTSIEINGKYSVHSFTDCQYIFQTSAQTAVYTVVLTVKTVYRGLHYH